MHRRAVRTLKECRFSNFARPLSGGNNQLFPLEVFFDSKESQLVINLIREINANMNRAVKNLCL